MFFIYLSVNIFRKTLLGWIELIENPKLYEAIKTLSIDDPIFISYIVKECKAQAELSQQYEVTQPAICQRFNKLIKTLKKIFESFVEKFLLKMGVKKHLKRLIYMEG